MLVFPRFFLLLAVLAFLQPSIWTIMAVIGLTGWMGVTRLVRAEFLALQEREFVVWSQSVGASGFRVVWRHILPNAMAPVLVAMTLGIPAAILTESGLSFLGLGVQPPYATWGNILNEGKDTIEIAWWLSFYPGLAILVTVLSYNLLGEGIRDALDPRLRQSGQAGRRLAARARAEVYFAFVPSGPKWRNWQTRTFEGRVGQPVGVRVPPSAPKNMGGPAINMAPPPTLGAPRQSRGAPRYPTTPPERPGKAVALLDTPPLGRPPAKPRRASIPPTF